MKKYLGIWTFLYLIVSYFTYGWIYNWRFEIECSPKTTNGITTITTPCVPNTNVIQLLLLVIIPFVGAIAGTLFWKKQHLISRVLLIISLSLTIYFLYEYLTPPILL